MPHSYQKEPHHLIITCSMNVLLDITHVILSISISLNHSMNFSCIHCSNLLGNKIVLECGVELNVLKFR